MINVQIAKIKKKIFIKMQNIVRPINAKLIIEWIASYFAFKD